MPFSDLEGFATFALPDQATASSTMSKSATAQRLKALALACVMALSACATAEEEAGSERLIEFPLESETIDLGDTDLTLPLDSPFVINSVRERVSEGQVFENLYTFQELRGYIRTARVFFGHYSQNTVRRLRSLHSFQDHARELSLPPGGVMKLGKTGRFEDHKRETLGFYAMASAEPYHSRCFIARVGYLLVDYASIEREPGSVDTIIDVLLCGKLPPEAEMVEFLGRLRAVENREAYRRELSRRAIGTI
jgi:hypothetical protein